MQKQYFGFNENTWSDQKWLQIAAQMKRSPQTRLKFARMISEAQHQSARFTRIAYASGIFFFVALLKFPVIRVQPGFKRFGISGAISYPIYNYINSIADQMKVKKIKTAYRKQFVDNQQHHRITL